ncbi:lasso peptide biosynthesis B2 protein [Metabacillus fastidiosus]|uniref:lasso peptide biosynthesis B2 protein n=1 Tax=Metabacillus fastidiosus TaxID=1458 RepID=UPI002E1DBF8A|nr:lasso peptide biosynthesis B2 protein [Metabacillus fastidiosus]
MKLLKKIKKFFSYPLEMKLLFLEAYLFLAWARILKLIPFSKVAPSLGIQLAETSLSNKSNKDLINHISYAVRMMSRHTFWESMCLVQAIAAMKMLERRRIESTLYLGTARSRTGKMIAHAWLRSGSYYLTGVEEMHKFTVVNTFAKKIGD